MTKFELPLKRAELLQYLNDIVTISKTSSSKELYDLDFTFHFFLDDTDLCDDPNYYIGHFLKDEKEASYVQKVAKSLDTLIDIYGGQLQNEEYVAKSEWADIVAAAKQALDYINSQDN